MTRLSSLGIKDHGVVNLLDGKYQTMLFYGHALVTTMHAHHCQVILIFNPEHDLCFVETRSKADCEKPDGKLIGKVLRGNRQ